MPPNGKMRQVIQTGAFHAPVVEQKAKWFDQIDLDPKTGGEPQQGTGILGNVRLEQREAQTISEAGFSGTVERSILIVVYTRFAVDLCGSLSHSWLFLTV